MNTLTDIWQDRRVNIGYETAEELAKHYNVMNWRGHPEAQRDATEDSLDALGYVGAIKKSVQSGVILDGHLRIEIALAKDPSIQLPVDYYDLSPDEEALALQVLDATTEMAEPIPDKLAALLARTREMTADRPGLGAMLERLKERAGINGHQKTEDAPPQIDKAAELQKVWGVKVGDVWELGQHRLVCGDCTDRTTVEGVMRGQRADMVFTSPPYNSNSELHGSDKFRGSLYLNKSIDMMPSDEYLQFNRAVFLCLSEFVQDDGNIFYNLSYNRNSRSEYVKVICDALNSGFRLHETIIWKKTGMPNPASTDVMTRDYEFVFLLNRASTYRTNKVMGEVRSNFWQISNTGAQLPEHKACFPVALPERAISETTNEGDLILDPFLGSGTTLIACQNLNRRARAIELDPGYAAVSIQRFVDLTGIEPKLITSEVA